MKEKEHEIVVKWSHWKRHRREEELSASVECEKESSCLAGVFLRSFLSLI